VHRRPLSSQWHGLGMTARQRSLGRRGAHAARVALLAALIVAAAVAPAAAVGEADSEEGAAAGGGGGGVGVLGPDHVVRWGPKAELVPYLPAYWERLLGPIGTVCITGDDRVGKSTLLSFWVRELAGPAGEGFTFAPGHTRTSHTRGLWSALLPAQTTGLGYHLNICDSQGLKQVAELEQWRLFSANVLVPSVLVYMLINVVQNDQIRDLAQFAHQFQQMSAEDSARFGSLLSPHLIVVIREESDFGGRGNATAHLEQALSSPGYREDKELIRKVFRTREAWPLDELPAEARRALREGSGLRGRPLASLPGAEAYRQTAQDVLDRVRAALHEQRAGFPRSGLELGDWYRSVATTVNSHQDGSMATLVNHAERIAEGKFVRKVLETWRGPVLAAFIAIFSLFVLGGCVGRWLDFVAWCAWLVGCITYIGTCPLVTAPLGGFVVARFCDEQVPARTSLNLLSSDAVLARICREASPYTAALIVSLFLGIASYRVVVELLRHMLKAVPKPTKVILALLVFGEAMGGSRLLESLVDWAILGPHGAGSQSSGAACAVLMVAGVSAAVELAVAVRHRHACARASREARALHGMVAARIEEVKALQASPEWATHYRKHAVADAIWRYRGASLWWQTAMCGQAVALGAWGLLIRPHCDVLLAVGAGGNLMYLAWRCLVTLLGAAGCCRGRSAKGPVTRWFEELAEADPDDEADAAVAASEASEVVFPMQLLLPETEEEKQRRAEIEEVRRSQERLKTRAQWWKKRD